MQGRVQGIFWWGAQGGTTINLGGQPKRNKNECLPLQYGRSLQLILNSYTLFVFILLFLATLNLLGVLLPSG